jgi:electron-transferring-flavoprotein dehydrogenase
MSIERESMEFDVVIVGAGPAGLSAAIRLAQAKQDLSICVIEKGATVGAHILSGAVLEPCALDELIPDWKQLDSPVNIPVTQDRFYMLSKKRAWHTPTPSTMRNEGNYVISLGQFCQWLATQAEALGVSIFPGFSAAEILYDDNDSVIGVQTGDMGLDKSGQATDRFQAGIRLLAKQTLFAEGCRGSLTELLIKKFDLSKDADPQTYGIGLKELWTIKPEKHQAGKVIHTLGWPLDNKTYGGSFIYHGDNQQIAIGFVIGLDYQNPYLDPFEEFQRFKTHPFIADLLEDGECLNYGARALNEGGLQSLPKLSFPGGLLIGCSAGFLNVGKIKGIHTAMKSGMLAAETILENINALPGTELEDYQAAIKNSWIYSELHSVRNLRPGFKKGLWLGLANATIDQTIFRGKAPWTLKHKTADHNSLKPANNATPIVYPKPDGKLSFDRLTQVFLSGTRHNENEPCHLKIKDLSIPIEYNLKKYDAPEQRYCPTGVYEIVTDNGNSKLQINAANCVHCKTCDIKDPKQNIVWLTPEGGDGPNYGNM